jgi:hypothetical protein
MRSLLILVAIIGFVASAVAQDRTIERSAKGRSDSNIRIGTYVSVKSDCTSGPLPTIRLISPPEHGKVAIKKVKIRARNFRQCLAVTVPGYVAFYRSQPGFSGTDLVSMEVKFPKGRTVVQKITVTVAGPDNVL